MLNLTRCTMVEIASLLPEARRAGLVFSPSTELYAALENGELIGMCGVVWYQRHCKLKNDYVIPSQRRKGYLDEMLDFRFNLARQRGLGYAEGTCTPLALGTWLKRGAVIVKRYSIHTKVRLIL